LEGPLSKWWYSQVAQTGDEVGGGFSGVYEMEKSLIQEFCGKNTGGTSEIEFRQGATENHGPEVCEIFSRSVIAASSPS
jgi:hypothetical protein